MTSSRDGFLRRGRLWFLRPGRWRGKRDEDRWDPQQKKEKMKRFKLKFLNWKKNALKNLCGSASSPKRIGSCLFFFVAGQVLTASAQKLPAESGTTWFSILCFPLFFLVGFYADIHRIRRRNWWAGEAKQKKGQTRTATSNALPRNSERKTKKTSRINLALQRGTNFVWFFFVVVFSKIGTKADGVALEPKLSTSCGRILDMFRRFICAAAPKTLAKL